tara:strand:- start:42 stop:248 length:207 start_codon:yes stop_codon:yes gene_type:complete
MIISSAVIVYQIVLGAILLVGKSAGGKNGVLFSYLLVFLWTITQTYGALMIQQLFIQGIIALLLYNDN